MFSQQLESMDILLVEDNPADVRMTKEALSDIQSAHKLHNVRDGQHAMYFLRKEKEYASAPRPDIILLDLNLPIKDGREVLAEIKADKDLHKIPVVVLTTSGRPEDISKAYDLNANCYIIKPINFDDFCNAIKSIENFWLKIAALPAC